MIKSDTFAKRYMMIIMSFRDYLILSTSHFNRLLSEREEGSIAIMRRRRNNRDRYQPMDEVNSDPDRVRLFFIRHGETDFNKSKIIPGHIDVELNEVGFRQATSVGIRLADIQFDGVYSSDLTRCGQTTQQIVSELKYSIMNNAEYRSPIEYRYELREKEMGQLEGMTREEAIGLADYHGLDINDGYGETRDEFTNRIRSGVSEILNDSRYFNYKNLLVVVHGGVIRQLLEMYGLEHGVEFSYIKNTSFTILEYYLRSGNDDDVEIINIGDARHLSKRNGCYVGPPSPESSAPYSYGDQQQYDYSESYQGSQLYYDKESRAELFYGNDNRYSNYVDHHQEDDQQIMLPAGLNYDMMNDVYYDDEGQVYENIDHYNQIMEESYQNGQQVSSYAHDYDSSYNSPPYTQNQNYRLQNEYGDSYNYRNFDDTASEVGYSSQQAEWGGHHDVFGDYNDGYNNGYTNGGNRSGNGQYNGGRRGRGRGTGRGRGRRRGGGGGHGGGRGRYGPGRRW